MMPNPDIVFLISRIAVSVASVIVTMAGIVFSLRWLRNGRTPNYPKLNYELLTGFTQTMNSFCSSMHELWQAHQEECANQSQALILQRDLMAEMRKYGHRCEEAHEMLRKLGTGQA